MKKTYVILGVAAIIMMFAYCSKKEEAKEENKMEDISNAMAPPQEMPAPAEMAKRELIPGQLAEREFNTEQYDYIRENEFLSSVNHPLSTFSIDVDRASYSNVRRFITQGALPPADAVRIEELVNYFNYDYPEPQGEHPFSITTEVSECPWNAKNKLVHIGLKGKSIDISQVGPSNLVFLIDVSGSMENQDKLPLLVSSFKLLVDNLGAKDHVAIVVYAGASGVVLPPTPCSNREIIYAALDRLSAGGSTAGAEGLELAYKTAGKYYIKGGNNRVILATDGDFNVGPSSDGELVRLIEQKRNEGIFLTVLGFGMGNYKDSKMEKLADKGDGNYAYIDNLLEAKKVLVKEIGGTLLTIAKDVKIQVEFNPLKVKEYRLIGYENRLLNQEDFDDDTKDAGEMGSGHTVTALYEIVPADAHAGGSHESNLKYQKTVVKPETFSSNDLLSVKFRYKEPVGSVSKLIQQDLKDSYVGLDKSSDNFRFAAAVAEFGMILRDSKFKGRSNFGDVLKLAKSAIGQDNEGYRRDFISLVEAARNLKKENI